jgi:DNA repair protein RecO (recombination protein O)
MKHQRTEGIILRVSDYNESDKLITFFSFELGKVTGIAKGAKRSKKRFSNKLELFSHLQIMYNHGRQSNLLFLSEAELLNSFLSLRQHYSRYVVGTQLCELVLRFTRDQDHDPQIFHLLLWAFEALNRGKTPLRISVLFQLKLLTISGYQPEFEKCAICDATIQPHKKYTMYSNSGSAICEKCCGMKEIMKENTLFLSVQTLNFLKKAQHFELQKLDRLQLPNRATEEALLFLYQYTRYLLQHDINSWIQVQNLTGLFPELTNRDS